MIVHPPVEAAALHQLRLLPLEELAMLAAHWVAIGLGGPALVDLSGRAARDREVADLWPAALAELGISLPRQHARREAMAWVAGEVTCGARDVRWLVGAMWPPDCDPQEDDKPMDSIVYAMDDILEWAPQALRGRTREGRPDPQAPDPLYVRSAQRALESVRAAIQAMSRADLHAADLALSA